MGMREKQNIYPNGCNWVDTYTCIKVYIQNECNWVDTYTCRNMDVQSIMLFVNMTETFNANAAENTVY